MTYYDLNMNSKRITSVQDPASAQDVATKNYVDVSKNVLSSWTTAGRPNPATPYLLGYNTTDARIDFYNGASWQQLQFVVPYITATGGVETTYTLSGTTYRVHSFTTTGASTFTISSLSTITLNNTIDYLVVAGGGSCANNFGSGGAGGMLAGTFTATSTGNYPITVGIGGVYTGSGNGANGGNSTLTTPASIAIATSIGGGGGGNTYTAGNSGGSGGGAGSSNGGQVYGGTSAGTAGQGNNGGASPFNSLGGGGGAGGAGTPLTTGQNVNGVGGAGLQNSIRTGSAVYYSAGGGPVSNATGYDRSGFGMGGQLFQNVGTSHLSGTQGIVVLRYVIG